MAILTQWTGAAGNGDWADAANWDNGVPLPGDTLTVDQQAIARIDNSIATAPFTVSIAGAQSAQDVTLDAANPPGAPAVRLTGTLLLEWNTTPSSSAFGTLDLRQGSFELDGGDLRVGIIRQNGGSLTVGDAASWGASTLDACLVAGPLTLAAGAALVVAQSSFAAFGVDGDTTVTVASGATLSARGDLGLGGASILDLAGGTLSLDGGSVTGGTVRLDGGSLAMTAGATLRNTTIDGDFNILGQSLIIGAETSVTFDSRAGAVPVTVSLDHGAALLVYGTLAIAGTASLDPGAVLWLIDGGVLQSATVEGGILRLSGNGTLSDASLDASITLLTDHGTPVLTITGSTTLGDPTDSVQQTIDLGGGTLAVAGTLALRDAVLTNGTVLVAAGGSLDADGMSALAGVAVVDTAFTRWTGNGDGQSWSDASNWSAGVPVSGHGLGGAHLAVALVNNDIAAPFSLVIDGSQSAQDVTLDAADPGGPAVDLTGTLDLGWGTAGTSQGLLDLKQGRFALDGGTLAHAAVRLAGGSLATGGDGTAGTLDGVWLQNDLSLDAGGTLVVAGDGLTLETAGSGPVLLELDGDTTLDIAAGLSLDGSIDLYRGAIRLDGGSILAGPDGARLIIADQPLAIAGAATLDAVEIAGAISLEAGATLTVNGATRFGPQLGSDTIQLDDSATLDIAGSLSLSESIAGYTGQVRLENSATLSGGLVQSNSVVVAGNASLADTTIGGYFTLDSGNGLSPTVAVNGLVQLGDGASAPDIDLGTGTVEVFGTLDLSRANYLTGGTIVVEAGGALILGGLTPDGTAIINPFATDRTLVGQDVTIAAADSDLLAGATISILTGANSDATPSGTPGTFVLDTAAAVEGYGRVSLADASGAALALVNGSFAAIGAGQTLSVAVPDWIGTGTGTLAAQDGATLLFGTPGSPAQGITSDTMLLLNVTAGAGATVVVGTDAAPGTIDTRLTLDAGSSLLFDDGSTRTSLEDSLVQLGGDDPRPGSYTSQLGVLDLKGGRDFRAAHALDVTGFIQLSGGTLSAPGITGHVAVIGGGAFGVLISPEVDGHGLVEADTAGLGFRASSGTLEMAGSITGGAPLVADAVAALPGSLPAYTQMTIAAGGVISIGATLGANDGVGFTGAGTLELNRPEGVSLAVSGTLEGASIHLAGLTVAGGSHGVTVNRGTLGDVAIVVIPADGGPLDTFDVKGDVDSTGVRFSSDGAGGSTLTFSPGANAARPIVNPGTNEGMTSPASFYFINPVHVREGSGAAPYDYLQIFNQASGSPGQQLLDAYVISCSGYALANGGFTDLAPGDNSNDLGAGQGSPIALNLYTGYGGLITGTVTIGFRSHDDGAAISGDLTDPTIGLGDQYIPSRTISLAEQVFRYGQLSFPKVKLFARATTDTQYSTLHLDLEDSAPADGYSEAVAARLASASGDFINPTGSSGWINPGATDSSAISFQVDANPADFASGRGTRQYGTFLFDVASADAFGYSGLGTTTRPQQSIAVEVDFYRLAQAGVPSDQVYVVHPTNNGTDRYAAVIPVRNSGTADGGSEGLVAAITGWGGDFSLTNPGTGEITPSIAAGSTDNTSLVYAIDTNPADFPGGRSYVQQGFATLHFVSDGTGTSNLGTTDLGSQTVGITVYFYQLAHPTFQTHYSVHATAPGSGSDTTTIGFAVTNTVTAGVAGITDLLDSQISLSSGDFTYGAHPEITRSPTGHATLLGEGQTNRSAITFQAVTNAALIAGEGLTEQTGSFSLLSFSVPTDPGYDSYGLGTQTVAVTVDVVGYAHPLIEGVDDGPTDPYTPFDAAGHNVTIDLGYVPEGFFGYHAFSFRNLAPNPTDDALYVGWNASSAAGTQYSPNLAPGASDDADGLYYFAGGPGDHSEQVTFTPFSINDTATTAMTSVYAEYDWHVLEPVYIGWGWGDVHLVSFAGTAYDFQAEGEFVLARAAPGGDGFEVQIRTSRYGARATVSVTREAAIRIGSQRLTIDASRAQPAWLDGAATALSPANAVLTSAGGQVVQTGNSWRITLASGEIVTVNANGSGAGAYLNVGVQLAQGAAPGSVEGLLGPANGVANDFRLADGTVLAHAGSLGPSLSQLYGVDADSWRVTDATSLLDYGAGQTTADFTDTRFPLSALNLASLPGALADTATTAAANAGLTGGALQQQAALDYALTGDAAFLSGAQNVQLQSAAPTLAIIAADTPALPAVVVLADATSVTELATGATSIGFSIGLTGTSDSITTIDWAVTAPDGTYLDAAAFGGTMPAGTVDVLIGATTAHFSVLIPAGALGSLPTAGLQVSIAAEGANPVAGSTARTTLINAAPVAGTPAQPDFAVIAGAPAPVSAGGTVDLGRFVQGEAIDAVQFQVSNLAAPGADDLSGTVSDSAAPDSAVSDSARADFALFLPGSGPLPAIAAGAYTQGVLLTAGSTRLGSHSDTVTLAPTTRNASGYFASLDPLAITVTDSIVAAAGTLTGAVTLDLASDGAGSSGLGRTSLAPQTISLAVAVDNYAMLSITRAGGDALLLGSGANLTLDFGTLLQGDPAATASLRIANAAAGLADLIDGGFTLQSGGGFTLSGFGDFSGLGAGQADTAPSVTLETTGTGETSETLLLHAFASNASGYDASLGEISLTLHASVAANGTTACFATGTRIRTTRGDIPVESLTPADIAVTASGRLAPIGWIGRRTLHTARRRLHREAAAQGWQLAADPALRLLAGDTPLQVQSDGAMRYAILPAGAARLVLASAISTPAETGTRPTGGQDTRRLGLAIEAIWLDGQNVTLDSPRLGTGWHAPEPGWRWTAGVATLDVRGAVHVDLRLSPVGRRLRYWRHHQEQEGKQESSFS